MVRSPSSQGHYAAVGEPMPCLSLVQELVLGYEDHMNWEVLAAEHLVGAVAGILPLRQTGVTHLHLRWVRACVNRVSLLLLLKLV